MDKLQIVNKWLERYADFISIKNNLVYELRSMHYKTRLFPLNNEGVMAACIASAKRNQDIYRKLPKI